MTSKPKEPSGEAETVLLIDSNGNRFERRLLLTQPIYTARITGMKKTTPESEKR